MSRKSKALEFVDAGWDIQVTGRHIEVTDAMKAYAIDKVSKIERFINQIIDVSVIMDIQKLQHRVDILMNVGHFKINSHATSSDMYSAIDKVIDKLEAQLRKYKSKIQDHHAKEHARIDMKVNVVRPNEPIDEFEINDAIPQNESPFQPHSIVTEETLPVKTLTFDEAMTKMELSSKDHFMLFMNEATKKLNVIYRREDGNYGVIEPICG